MQRAKVWTIAIALLATGLLLSATMASFGEEDEAEHDDNVQVEDTPGTDAKTLIFTEAAMSHLDVQTAPVRRSRLHVREKTWGGVSPFLTRR